MTHLYRADPLGSIGKIEDGIFRPVEWLHTSVFKHRELAMLSTQKPKGDPSRIFRMCYWSDEATAKRDCQGRGQKPMMLMPVDKTLVDRALTVWIFDEDDLAKNGAVMYFTQCKSDQQVHLAPAGVPLTEFEVWNPLDGWIATSNEPQLLEAQRMVAEEY